MVFGIIILLLCIWVVYFGVFLFNVNNLYGVLFVWYCLSLLLAFACAWYSDEKINCSYRSIKYEDKEKK